MPKHKVGFWYWERSPSLSNTTNFMNVNTNGNPGNNNNASNVNAAVLRFSTVPVTRIG